MANKKSKSRASRTNRHSKSGKKPVVIDLDPADVTKKAPESAAKVASSAASKATETVKGTAKDTAKSASEKAEPVKKAGQTLFGRKSGAQGDAKPAASAKPKKAGALGALGGLASGIGAAKSSGAGTNAGSTGGNTMGSKLGAGVAGGALALLGGAAFQAMGLLPSFGGADDSNQQALTGTITALEERIAGLESAPKPEAGSGSTANIDLSAVESGIAKASEEASEAAQAAAAAQSSVDGFSGQFDGLKSEIESVTGKISSLESAVAGGGAGEDASLKNLSDRIAALDSKIEGALSGVDEKISTAVASSAGTSETVALKDDVASVQQKLTALAATVTVLSAVKPPSIEPLQAEIATLQSKLDEMTKADTSLSDKLEQTSAGMSDQLAQSTAALKEQITSVQSGLDERLAPLEERAAGPSPEQKAALVIAATSLKTQIDKGGDFGDALKLLEDASGGSDEINALKGFAASGVPTIETLVKDFPNVSDKIMVAVNPKTESGALDKLFSNARSLVKVRPVATPGNVPTGDGPQAVVGRMGLALKEVRLDDVASEWAKLPETGQAASKDFIDRVNARHQADGLMQTVLKGLISDTASSGSNG